MFFTEGINVEKDGLSTRFWSDETEPFIIIPRGYFPVFKCHILVPMANVKLTGFSVAQRTKIHSVAACYMI